MFPTSLSKFRKRRHAVIAALAAGVSPLPRARARGADGDVAALAGVWAGEILFRGERTPIYVEITPGRDGAMIAKLSLPVLDLYDVGIDKATFAGDTLRFASFAFDYDGAADRLRGKLPRDIVPVYELATTLARAPRVERRPRADLTAPDRDPVWSVELGAPVWSDPATADGVVFVGADDGRLRALAARDGTPRWTYTADGPLRSAPSVAGGHLYVTSDDGVLHCIDLRDARVRWQSRVNRSRAERLPATDPKSKYDFHGAAACILGGTVFVGTHEGRVLALDGRDGRPRWSFTTGDRIIAAPCVAGGLVYVGSFDGKVYALQAATGAPLWTFDARAPVTSTPTRVGDVVVAGSRAYDLWGLDAATGRVRWNRYVWFSWIESSPAVAGRFVYVGSSDAAKVFAVDAFTGKSAWTADVHGYAWGTPALDGDRLYVGTRGEAGPIPHRAHALALDRATGKVLWQHSITGSNAQAPQGIAGSAVVVRSASRVVMAAVDGRVRAFDTR